MPKGWTEYVYRRTDNTMAKWKHTKGQTWSTKHMLSMFSLWTLLVNCEISLSLFVYLRISCPYLCTILITSVYKELSLSSYNLDEQVGHFLHKCT